ncbi:MAG: ABC-F family ATP-binding cassette domain-containing protein [Synergistaceae bacterium]|nr:ABC-F family ATP-binding cassette domain-containing protein [Synergistaceae bacterium]
MSWQINEQGRIALAGDNGAGKTTLLRIISGEVSPDDGRVTISPDTKIGYLPQDLVELGDGTVMRFLRSRAGLLELEEELDVARGRISECPEGSRDLPALLARHETLERDFAHRGGYEFEATAKKVLRGLGFAPHDADRHCGEFSGGWRMRVALAGVLLQKPDVLLLDEPTNHLDTESMEWLEGWLRDHRGVLIFVSHDRRFADKMATEVALLARGEITHYQMGYERYLAEAETARERLERVIEDQKERIGHMQRFVDRFRYKASKATQVQSRIKQLEKMEIYEMDAPSKTVNIRFPDAPRSGWEVLSGRGLSKGYGGIRVFSDLDVEINRGQRVALVGVNGAGKSTLLRLLSAVERPDAGEVRLGHNVRRAYFSQESAQNLDYSHTVWEEASRTGSKITEAEKRGLLGAFLFSGDDIKKPVRVLSGGEKSRLALFKLLLSDTNFLILDEPTNHLDANTLEIFEEALLQYGGTILIVSHDRFFLDSLADRVLELRDGTLYDYRGNYSRFIEKREERLRAQATDADAGRAKGQGKRADEPMKNAYDADARQKRRQEAQERNRLYRERKVFVDKIGPLEKAIAEAEARRGEIDALLCRADVLADSERVRDLFLERGAVTEEIESGYKEWERLNEALEEVC